MLEACQREAGSLEHCDDDSSVLGLCICGAASKHSTCENVPEGLTGNSALPHWRPHPLFLPLQCDQLQLCRPRTRHVESSTPHWVKWPSLVFATHPCGPASARKASTLPAGAPRQSRRPAQCGGWQWKELRPTSCVRRDNCLLTTQPVPHAGLPCTRDSCWQSQAATQSRTHAALDARWRLGTASRRAAPTHAAVLI